MLPALRISFLQRTNTMSVDKISATGCAHTRPVIPIRLRQQIPVIRALSEILRVNA